MEASVPCLRIAIVSTAGAPDAAETPNRWIASPPPAEWTPRQTVDQVRASKRPPVGSVIFFASFSGRGPSGGVHHGVPTWVVQWPVVEESDLWARGVCFEVQRHEIYFDADLTLAAGRVERVL